jgi:hypothetical protein
MRTLLLSRYPCFARPAWFRNAIGSMGWAWWSSIHIALAQPGSVDVSFNPGDALQGSSVDVLALRWHDGGLLVGGDFHHFYPLAPAQVEAGILGWQCYGILKLSRSGEVDPAFHAGVGVDGVAFALAATDEPVLVPHTIYLGGDFTRVGGVTRNGVARLMPNGMLDSTFRPINQEGDMVYSLAFHPYANYCQILVGGDLSGTGARGVLRLNRDGTGDTFWPDLSEDDVVYALAVEPESSTILVGGELESYPGVARLMWDGREDTSFWPDTSYDDVVYAVAFHSWNGEMGILLGGEFDEYPGLVRLHWDGTIDEAFMENLNEGMDGVVIAIVVQPNGAIVVGGEFATVNGFPRKGVARLRPNGTVDATFQPGAGTEDGDVHALALDAYGQFYLGGNFTRVDGFPRRGVARLNGDLAPSVLRGPFAITAYEGQRVTNWVEVASALQPTSFQWYKDESRLLESSRIHGTQSSRLTLNPALMSDTGYYAVCVSNPAGAVLSRIVLTHILPLPNRSNTGFSPNPILSSTANR